MHRNKTIIKRIVIITCPMMHHLYIKLMRLHKAFFVIRENY